MTYGLVECIVLFLLAGFTALYAYQTGRLVDETRAQTKENVQASLESRRALVKPLLQLYLRANPRHVPGRNSRFNVDIVNLGLGPATGIRVAVYRKTGNGQEERVSKAEKSLLFPLHWRIPDDINEGPQYSRFPIYTEDKEGEFQYTVKISYLDATGREEVVVHYFDSTPSIVGMRVSSEGRQVPSASD